MATVSSTTIKLACRTALAVGALSFMLIAAPTPADAKTCKSWGFVGQAVGATEALATVKARLNWSAKVKAHWNLNWANWNLAASRWTHCDPRRNEVQCIANGVPCKR